MNTFTKKFKSYVVFSFLLSSSLYGVNPIGQEEEVRDDLQNSSKTSSVVSVFNPYLSIAWLFLFPNLAL